jgi:hypothetical protein
LYTGGYGKKPTAFAGAEYSFMSCRPDVLDDNDCVELIVWLSGRFWLAFIVEPDPHPSPAGVGRLEGFGVHCC